MDVQREKEEPVLDVEGGVEAIHAGEGEDGAVGVGYCFLEACGAGGVDDEGGTL